MLAYKNHIIFPLILLLCSVISFGQDFNTKIPLCDSCEKELSLKFESTSFFKNNEYSNQFTKGFTGIGYFVKPTLQYYITKNTKVNAGLFLQQYAGLEKFTKVIPIFSVHQQVHKNIDLIFGSLHGSLSHQLAEPLFRFDRYYQNNVEYGLQALYNSKFAEADVWLNWENYIFKNDEEQEEIEAGLVFDIKLFNKNKFEINVPLQLLFYHKGGQIDVNDAPVTTLFNGNTGIHLKHLYKNKNSIAFKSLFFWYDGIMLPESGINSQLFKSGAAWYFKLKHQLKNFNYSLGYWNANKFIAPKGEYLFLSISENNNTFAEAIRSLICAKAAYIYQPSKPVKIELRADVYYDTISNSFDYAYGLYLFLNEDFFIKQLK